MELSNGIKCYIYIAQLINKSEKEKKIASINKVTQSKYKYEIFKSICIQLKRKLTIEKKQKHPKRYI